MDDKYMDLLPWVAVGCRDQCQGEGLRYLKKTNGNKFVIMLHVRILTQDFVYIMTLESDNILYKLLRQRSCKDANAHVKT